MSDAVLGKIEEILQAGYIFNISYDKDWNLYFLMISKPEWTEEDVEKMGAAAMPVWDGESLEETIDKALTYIWTYKI
jgi:hypothetical protein